MTTGGIFQTDDEAANYYNMSSINGRQRKAGDLWFVDLNGDEKITRGTQTLDNPGDMSIIGNSSPRYSFGLRGNVEWKGFDFIVFFQGIGKRDVVINNTYYLNPYQAQFDMATKELLDYWTPDNTDAFYPAPLLQGGTDVTTAQTRFLQDGSYVRLKQLTLGFTIPQILTQKVLVERLRIYFSGNNLWEMTNMVDINDPEQTGPINYPLYRSISVGVNIDF